MQAREKVLHAEKIKTEHVLGNEHECWDVHADKNRWWVITNRPDARFTLQLVRTLRMGEATERDELNGTTYFSDR